jgi:alkylation response protein AidB-like acyl-CoA dehydrogenase
VNFDLTTDQQLLAETIDRMFVSRFPLSYVREMFDGSEGHDDDLWRAYSELGLFAILVPTEYGGIGGDLLDLGIAAERLGYAAAPGPFLEHVLATLAIAIGGSSDQKRHWLPGLAEGRLRATLAVAETPARWTMEEWTLGANARLQGEKQWVPYPELADVTVVGTSDGLTLVRKAAPGLSVLRRQGIDRTRRLATVGFDGVEHEPLPAGRHEVERVRDAALILLSADAYGAAARCVDMSVEYAKTREQFGVTIGHFQALKHQLADLALEVDTARFLYWYAAHAFDHLPHVAPRFAALAKSHVTESAVQAGRRAVEYHGGIGFTWAHDIHFFLKRAIFDRAYFGDPAVQRARVAALNDWGPEIDHERSRDKEAM